MKELGISLNLHRARPCTTWYASGALILTMTRAQADYVKIVFPGGRGETLRGYAGLTGDIDDPYGGPPEVYIKTAAEDRGGGGGCRGQNYSGTATA
jgi:protein-tyrosine-phosphatase